jgi:hypothetical protein
MSETKQLPPTGLYLDDMVATGKPSLGDLHTVSWLVREFARFCIGKYSDFRAGKGDRDPLPAITAEAALMGRIFQGGDERFDAQPWNTPNRIGSVFRVLTPDETIAFGDPGTGFFMWVAAQTMTLTQEMNDGTPEAQIKATMDDMMDDVTKRLLGVKY